MKHCRYGLSGALFVALLVLVFGCLAAGAQQTTGTIVGTIRDSQGAMVTAATITATNVETSFSRSTTTDSEGGFRIPFLPVGTYTVGVDAAGFKKFVQQNVIITIDQTQTLNLKMSIGVQNETVTVTEAPPLVNTDTAELGRTVDNAEVVGLPLTNRNVYSELSLTPGVMSNSASDNGNPNGTPNFVMGVPSTQVVINGGIDNGAPMVSYYLDGGINMTGIRNYGNPLPNPDAIKEFRVETSNFAAQYGRMSAGVVSAITKSGTNRIHGSLFEFHREAGFNAYPWHSAVGPKPPYHRNNYGAVFGGPIKRDKSFFFVSFAGLRQNIGQALAGTVLTANERIGDFTADANKVYMPGTKTQVKGTNSSPNCGTPTLNCVPAALLDKTAAYLLSHYIPTPTDTTPNSNIYRGTYTAPTNQDEYLAKYDENLSSNDHITGSFFYLNTLQYQFGGGPFPYMTNDAYSKQFNTNVTDTHIFNATTINQTWLSWNRVLGGRVNLPAGIGIDDMGSTYTTQGPKTLPQLNLTGYFTSGTTIAGPASHTNFYTVRDLLTKTIGKHSLGLGGELSTEKDLTIGNNNNYGIFTFNTSAPTTTGFVPSDFVTGQVYSMEQDTPYSGDISQFYYALYAQDYYRLTPRFTVSLGLRWDLQTSPVHQKDWANTFVPNVQSTMVPSAPKGMLFPGDAGVPRGIVDDRIHHISPRAGIVWDPKGDGKTAIRAGAGVFFGSVQQNEWCEAGSQPFAVRQLFNSVTSLSDVYSNKASFPNGNPFPYTFDPKSPRFLPAASIAAMDKNFQWPLTYQINVAVQHEFPQKISLTSAYVATLSHHLPYQYDVNYAGYAAGANTGQASINARRPYDPGVLGQVLETTSIGTSSYHALQMSAARPMTRDLKLSGYWVLSHSLQSMNESAQGSAGPAQDYSALSEERGPTDYDRRQMASVSGIWDINYYRNSERILKQVLNGWEVTMIALFQSGVPVNVLSGLNNNLDSLNMNRPNLVPGVSAFYSPHRNRNDAANAWFNTAAFHQNGPGQVGGIGPGGADGNTPRNYLRAPGFRTVNLGLHRDISFERGMVFQIRVDATNALNLVSLNPPGATLSNSSSFGKILSANTPRLIQVGGRFYF